MGKPQPAHAVLRISRGPLAPRQSRRYLVDKVIEEAGMSVLAAAVDIETSTMRRVSWRLMPFLLLAYLICYIDRVNIGFAALQMNKAVGIDPKTYGLGAGISSLATSFWKCQAIWHWNDLVRVPGSRAS